jgi:hypothetical protein
MIKNKKSTKSKATRKSHDKHWLSRTNPRFRPILVGVAIAVFAGPTSWLMVSAQSDSSAIGRIGASTAAAIDEGKPSTNNTKSSGHSSTSKTSRSSKSATADAKKTNAAKTSASSKSAASTAKPTATPAPVAAKPAPAPPAVPTPVAVSTASHDNITSTIFWVGEPAGADNDNITNTVSAWDEAWQAHFGGVDDPTSRNSFAPAAFTPKENPFYFALPYSDFTDNGDRKASAGNCPNAAALAKSDYSWCKNAWIKITHAGKTTYAQWQDVGPLEEDDTAYVFGSARPKNTWGAKAGLDVSPAVRDYLGLQDVDSVSWSFVSAGSVPAGPWRTVVTTSLGT